MKSSEMGGKPIDERIKAARKVYGLSRVRAAKQWGICAATIRSWEEKQRAPSGLYLARITRILARLETRKPEGKLEEMASAQDTTVLQDPVPKSSES